jgi:hypothetical protein
MPAGCFVPFRLLFSPAAQGVSSVRQHLRDIDDVPLLVSLFADASSATAEEMLRILQENGGVVCVLGSPLHGENTRLFQQADVAVAFGACFAFDS